MTETKPDPIVMYLVVREALGMSVGKTAAQCAHASQMLQLLYHRKTWQHWLDTTPRIELFEQWLNSSYCKVVLRADEKEWENIKGSFFIEGETGVIVVDNGLTELEPGTETVIGLWPMHKSQAPKIVKRLQVLK